jgi:hypothetical protein
MRVIHSRKTIEGKAIFNYINQKHLLYINVNFIKLYINSIFKLWKKKEREWLHSIFFSNHYQEAMEIHKSGWIEADSLPVSTARDSALNYARSAVSRAKSAVDNEGQQMHNVR